MSAYKAPTLLGLFFEIQFIYFLNKESQTVSEI